MNQTDKAAAARLADAYARAGYRLTRKAGGSYKAASKGITITLKDERLALRFLHEFRPEGTLRNVL